MIPPEAASLTVVAGAGLGIAFALLQAKKVLRLKRDPTMASEETANLMNTMEEAKGADSDDEKLAPSQRMAKLESISDSIRVGAINFLLREYLYMSAFVVLFSIMILFLVGAGDNNYGRGFATMVAFVVGALTSVLSGFIGMRIAVEANWRTTLAARTTLEEPFRVAFRAGAVMGFGLCGLGLLVLFVLIVTLDAFYPFKTEATALFEVVTGYGLGGSSIALFGRVGGGIYTKAADVGADLAGKIDAGLPEDDARNPGVIADNVGDNVGDIAGMGADLFGSFAESTCAALVISASSGELRTEWTSLMFPLAVSGVGILVCILVSFVATELSVVSREDLIERTLKMQLVYSTLGMLAAVYFLADAFLPDAFCVKALDATGTCPTSTQFHAFLCVGVGLVVGLLVGLITEYYTSHGYNRGPVQEVAEACRSSAASNIIFGLALGYQSAVAPVTLLAGTIFMSFHLCGMYGVALAAIGMLSTLCLGLTIDAYGPVADNAGGIAEMSKQPKEVRHRTDALDAAGNTTAAIGKGFAIGSAALVSLALFGAFVTRTGIAERGVDVLEPMTFAGLLFGAMLPYWFSAMTMKSVGDAANAMVREIKRQWRAYGGIKKVISDKSYVPDYAACVKISTDASLREMIKPGALTLLMPLVVGTVFGVHAVAGMLAGNLVSGVQMAISSSNSGGAWDNAKKYIGSQKDGPLVKKHFQWVLVDPSDASVPAEDLTHPTDDGSAAPPVALTQPVMKWAEVNTPEYEAAVTGDTVGDPLKDTSGPSLNILLKLMAIVSLVFADFFVRHSFNLGSNRANDAVSV